MEARAKRWLADATVEEFIGDHGGELLAVARRYSATAADAEDAYQRALELLLTKLPDAGVDDPLAWMCTAVRNEALMIRRKRRKIVEGAFEPLAATLVAVESPPDEQTQDAQDLAVAREALKRINPDQARCLLLRADGLSYAEIESATGFTSSKVKRCLVEGRRVARGFLRRIEIGAECRRLEPQISLAADGEISLAAQRELDEHLRNCKHCQATMREFVASPSRVAAAVPLGTAFAASGVSGRGHAWLHTVFAWINDRIVAPLTGGAEHAATFRRAAVAAVAAATVVGGGATLGVASSDRAHTENWGAVTTAQALPHQSAASRRAPAPAVAPAARVASGDDVTGLDENGSPLDPNAPEAIGGGGQGEQAVPDPTLDFTAPDATGDPNGDTQNAPDLPNPTP